MLAVGIGSPVAGVVDGLWHGPSDGPPFDHAALVRSFGLTVALALSVAVIAAAFGGAIGLALATAPLYGAIPLAIVASAGLLAPPYVYGMAWIELTGREGALVQATRALTIAPDNLPGPFSFLGATLVLACRFYPLALWAVWVAARHTGRAQWEAAEVFGAPRDRVRHVLLPACAPALAASALLVSLLTLLSQTIPTLLQTPVYTTQLLTRFSAFYDTRGALLLALPLIGMGALLLPAAFAAAARMPSEQSEPLGAQHHNAPRRSRIQWTAALWAPVLIASGLPLAALIYRALPWSNLTAALDTAGDELAHSVGLAIASATAITLAGLLVASTAPRWRHVLALASPFPYLLSGPALGMALIAWWNHPGWRGAVYDSPAILVIAQASRYAFIGIVGAVILRNRFPLAQLDAAHANGAPQLRAMATIALPQLRWHILGLWLLGFAFAFGEAEAGAMVSPPGATTLGVRLMALIHYGPGPVVAALCLVTMAVVLCAGACGVMALRIGGRRASS